MSWTSLETKWLRAARLEGTTRLPSEDLESLRDQTACRIHHPSSEGKFQLRATAQNDACRSQTATRTDSTKLQ